MHTALRRQLFKLLVASILSGTYSFAIAQTGWLFRCAGNRYENTTDADKAIKLAQGGCKLMEGESRASVTGSTTPSRLTSPSVPAIPPQTQRSSAPANCGSSITLALQSTGYSGPINIEFRRGPRPGSKVAATHTVVTSGTWTVPDVCPGRYFFAFSTPSSESVNVTRDFDMDGQNAGTLTVTYSRASAGGQKVGSARRNDL